MQDHIRVNTVSPGSIIWDGGGWDDIRQTSPYEFAAYERDGFPMGRLGHPEELADVDGIGPKTVEKIRPWLDPLPGKREGNNFVNLK